MTAMNRRELIKKALAGTAVVAVGMTVVPSAVEAAPLSAGRTLPPDATDEVVQNVWHWHGHYRRRRRRHWRRRRRWRRRYWRRRYWDCWWWRGRRVCDWY
jgi:hypothetical protein